MEEDYYELNDGDGELDEEEEEEFLFEAAPDRAGDGCERETNRTVDAPMSSQVWFQFLSRPPLAAASRRRPVTAAFAIVRRFFDRGGCGFAAGAMRLGTSGVVGNRGWGIVMAIELVACLVTRELGGIW